MERRSERLANLQRLNPPISYRETRVKRVFKRIRRRRCTVAIVPVSGPEVEQARPTKKSWIIMLAILFGIQCGMCGPFQTWKLSEVFFAGLDSSSGLPTEALGLEKNAEPSRQIEDVLQQHRMIQHLLKDCGGFEEPQQDRFPQLGGSRAESSGYIRKEDLALKSAGASVVKTSESFPTGARVCMFGIFCWEYTRSPDLILERDNAPGNCWAMNGREGYVVIKLSQAIRPVAVTVDHISKMVSYNDRSSAPKYVAVYGLNDDFEKQEGTFLGTFTYRNEGSATQTFRLEEENSERFKYLRFRILDNWGHPDYTCIYGFRVYSE